MVTEREERAQFFVRLCTIYNRNDNLKKNYIENSHYYQLRPTQE